MKKILVVLLVFLVSGGLFAKSEDAVAKKEQHRQKMELKQQKKENRKEMKKEKKEKKEKKAKKEKKEKKEKETPKGILNAAEKNKGKKVGFWNKWFADKDDNVADDTDDGTATGDDEPGDDTPADDDTGEGSPDADSEE